MRDIRIPLLLLTKYVICVKINGDQDSVAARSRRIPGRGGDILPPSRRTGRAHIRTNTARTVSAAKR